VRSITKFTASLSVLSVVAGGAVYYSTALASPNTPKSFFACVNARNQVTSISTSSSLICGSGTKVSWSTAGRPGPRGSNGSRGLTGPAGATGAKGAAGPSGPQGLMGPKGATGSTGAKGATGPSGPQGATGLPGIVGPTGPKGSTGSPGVTYNCNATPYPGADFADCNLGQFGWFGENYDGANFSGIQTSYTVDSLPFGGTNYSGPAIYGSSSMRNTNFSGANLQYAYLYGNANFTNANFTGADLTGATLYGGGNFTNANFTGANLSGASLYAGGIFTNANFTGANLTGALLSQSTLSSAVWNNTTCPGGTNSSAYTPQTCVGH